jgi:hypothetical protein
MVQAGAVNGGEGVAAGGRLGNAWCARERAAGKGNRAGAGGGRHMGFTLAGGGAAAAAAEQRPGGSTAGGRTGNRAGHVLGEEEEREGSPGDLLVNSKNFRDLSVN